MKSVSVLTRLVTVLTATMLTICPVALPAADNAPYAHRAPGAESGSAPQCLMPQRAPAGQGGADRGRHASGVGVAPAAERTDLPASDQDDLASALLEDLVKKDQ